MEDWCEKGEEEGAIKRDGEERGVTKIQDILVTMNKNWARAGHIMRRTDNNRRQPKHRSGNPGTVQRGGETTRWSRME